MRGRSYTSPKTRSLRVAILLLMLLLLFSLGLGTQLRS